MQLDQYADAFTAVPAEDERVERGGKVLLPPSVMKAVSTMNVVYPLQFRVESFRTNPKRMHCGVLEFTAVEGQAVMPLWMFRRLGIEPGEPVRFTTVALPHAHLIKLRPKEASFVQLSNPRAVLEAALSRFSCLTVGDYLGIYHAGTVIHIEVREITDHRSRRINEGSIVDTDVKVEFERPLDMPPSPVRAAAPTFPAQSAGTNVIGGTPLTAGAADGIDFTPQSVYTPPTLAKPGTTTAEPEKPAFAAFAGTGRSLIDKPLRSVAPGPTANAASSVGRGAPPAKALAPAAKPLSTPPSTASSDPASAPFVPFGGKGRTLQ